MDRASDFELDGRVENSFHGGKTRPSSRWSWLRLVHYEQVIHPFHPSCTTIAPETYRNLAGLAARFRINLQYPPTLSSEKFSVFYCSLWATDPNQRRICPSCSGDKIASIMSTTWGKISHNVYNFHLVHPICTRSALENHLNPRKATRFYIT